MSLNIRELQNSVLYRQQKNNEIYEQVLKLVHKKIIITNETTLDCKCVYKMPLFIYGLPLYNPNKCIQYIVNKLVNNGFYVEYIAPYEIFISWL